jgi:hypothetical protein
VVEDLVLHDGIQKNLQSKRRILLGTMVCAVLWENIPASIGQGLPSGGGPVPALRRGADEEIEVVPPNTSDRRQIGQHGTPPAAVAPKPAQPAATLHRAAPAARSQPPPTRQPVIMVAPVTPRVPDTTPRGAVVATYSVMMSDGSPFTGTVRFGAPYYDGKGVFALSGNKIIVNPDGPGLGPNRTTITDRITLDAIP